MEETLRHNSLSQQTPSLSQQTPVVNKAPSWTNPVVNKPRRPQTLSLSRFSRHRDSATLCYLLRSTSSAIFLRQTNHSKNHCRCWWQEKLRLRRQKGVRRETTSECGGERRKCSNFRLKNPSPSRTTPCRWEDKRRLCGEKRVRSFSSSECAGEKRICSTPPLKATFDLKMVL